MKTLFALAIAVGLAAGALWAQGRAAAVNGCACCTCAPCACADCNCCACDGCECR